MFYPLCLSRDLKKWLKTNDLTDMNGVWTTFSDVYCTREVFLLDILLRLKKTIDHILQKIVHLYRLNSSHVVGDRIVYSARVV